MSLRKNQIEAITASENNDFSSGNALPRLRSSKSDCYSYTREI